MKNITNYRPPTYTPTYAPYKPLPPHQEILKHQEIFLDKDCSITDIVKLCQEKNLPLEKTIICGEDGDLWLSTEVKISNPFYKNEQDAYLKQLAKYEEEYKIYSAKKEKFLADHKASYVKKLTEELNTLKNQTLTQKQIKKLEAELDFLKND